MEKISGTPLPVEAKRTIENIKERNAEDWEYRLMLINNKLIEEDEKFDSSVFRRVREIAFHNRIKSIEEARSLAMLEFSIEKMVKEGDNAVAIFGAIGEDLTHLVSELFKKQSDKNKEEVCSRIAYVTLSEFVESCSSENKKLFIEDLLDKIAKRESMSSTLATDGTLHVDEETRLVGYTPNGNTQ